MARAGAGSDAREGAAPDRARGDGRVDHAGDADVDAEGGAAVDLGRDIQASLRRAQEAELVRRADRRLAVEFDGCGGAGEFAVARRPAGGGVRDDAGIGREIRERDIPATRRGDLQSLTGARAGLLQILAGAPHGAGAARAHALIDAVVGDAAIGARVLRAHLLPVAVEFLGDDHRHGGPDALTHLRLGDADGDRVVRVDDQPGVDLRAGFVDVPGRFARASERHVEGDGEAAGGRGRGLDEAAAREARSLRMLAVHVRIPPQAMASVASSAARWIAVRMRW